MVTEFSLDLASSQSLQETLKKLISLVKEFKKNEFLELKFGCNSADGKFEEYSDTSILTKIYYMGGFDQNKEQTLDCPELIFFDAAVQFPELRIEVLRYIEAVMALEGFELGGYKYDYEILVGYYAVMALAASDKSYIKTLIDYLNRCDMDHEVRESGAILLMVDEFGWCIETFDLLIARCTTCSGQHGHEQLEDFLEGDLSNYIKDQANKDYFYKHMQEYLVAEHGEDYQSEMEEDEGFAEECGYYMELLEE